MDAWSTSFKSAIEAGSLYVLETGEDLERKKKMMKVIFSLVELVGEIPPRLTVVVSFTVLTLYMEKSEPWSRYLPAIIECIQQLSNCLPLCPGSMSHLIEECDKLAECAKKAPRAQDQATLRREILEFKDKLLKLLPLVEDEHEEDEEEHENEEHGDEEEEEHGDEEEEEHGDEEESMIIEVEEGVEVEKDEDEVVAVEEADQMESDNDSMDEELLKRVKRKTGLEPVASSSVDIWTSDESDANESDTNESDANEAGKEMFYSAFGRNPKNRWPAKSVKDLIEGVNLYGNGKWKQIYRSYSFPNNVDAPKLKDKWRNLVKYKYVKKCGGKYVLS